MKPLEEIYGPKFFARRDKLLWRAEIVCNAVDRVFHPLDVIDVGCGIGEYVQFWQEKLNISAWGIEGVDHPYFVTKNIAIQDMRLKQIVRLRSDLVVCLEVLEHIEAEYSDVFVENLTKLSDRILVSAAPPGAGGHHHVNCQPQSYWHKKFLEFGYDYDEVQTQAIRQALQPWKHRKELYHNNLMVFIKGGPNG